MGFSFCNKQSKNFDIKVQKIYRPLLPELCSNEIKITGKHGSYDFGNNTYSNRIIEVEIAFIGKNKAERIAKTRLIASWLSQKGELIFDDEPNIRYIGRIYSSAALETFAVLGKAKVIFNCKPFGYSDTKVIETDISKNNQNIIVKSEGTYETPFRIRLKNIGSNTINQITLIKIK